MPNRLMTRVRETTGDAFDHLRNLSTETIDNIGIVATNKTMWGGAWGGVVGWLANVNWLGLAGFLIALAGLVANVYFMRRRDKREEAESAARIAALKDRCER